MHEDCTVARRWLRFAYLVPGAAGLAVLLVETAGRGDFVANVGELFLAAVGLPELVGQLSLKANKGSPRAFVG